MRKQTGDQGLYSMCVMARALCPDLIILGNLTYLDHIYPFVKSILQELDIRVQLQSDNDDTNT